MSGTEYFPASPLVKLRTQPPWTLTPKLIPNLRNPNEMDEEWIANNGTIPVKIAQEWKDEYGDKTARTPAQQHKGLTRAKSGLSTQLRKTHIELNCYLHWRRVPGIEHPGFPSCGFPSQNAKHMVMACPVWPEGRGEVLRKAKKPTFHGIHAQGARPHRRRLTPPIRPSWPGRASLSYVSRRICRGSRLQRSNAVARISH